MSSIDPPQLENRCLITRRKSASVREYAAIKEVRAEVAALRMNIEDMRVRRKRDALIAGAERLAAGKRVESAVREEASTVPTSG